MLTKHYLWFVMIIILPLVVISACGGDDDDGETASMTSQAAVTTSAQPTSTQPTTATNDKDPVKIGVISAWSGATAMMGLYYVDPIVEAVQKQVEDMGGILGGRPVEFVKCDSEGSVSGASSCATRLITKDKVIALTIGGSSPADGYGVAQEAERQHVLFASVLPNTEVADLNYTVVCSMASQAVVDDATKGVLEVLTPTPATAAVLTYDNESARWWISRWKKNLEAAGVEVVNEEYVPLDLNDFSPYLTKIKYEDPDCLVTAVDTAQYLAVAKQIMDLGGWGDIQNLAFATGLTAVKMPGAVGWIVISPWHSSADDPESLRLKEYFAAATDGDIPAPMHIYMYNTLWTAIHAIELAGTDDPEDIARAARSGNLEFDTPMGKNRVGTDGNNSLRSIFVQIQEGGVTVPIAR